MANVIDSNELWTDECLMLLPHALQNGTMYFLYGFSRCECDATTTTGNKAVSKILFSFDLLQIAVARHKESELVMTSYIFESSVLSPHDSTTV